jgi:hypothetical protein
MLFVASAREQLSCGDDMKLILVTLVTAGYTVLFPEYVSAGLVEYSGEALPENSVPAFEYRPSQPFLGDLSATERFVGGGIFTLSNANATGSLEYSRRDEMPVSEPFVAQFRVRVPQANASTGSVISGAVAQFSFGSNLNADPKATFFLFVQNDSVRLRQFDRVGPDLRTVDDSFELDTKVFNTLTVVKENSDRIQVYAGSRLMLDNLFLTDFGGTPVPLQRFQVNPSAVTEWDFFRYASGDDALNLIPIPVPEPGTITLTILILMVSIRHRRS